MFPYHHLFHYSLFWMNIQTVRYIIVVCNQISRNTDSATAIKTSLYSESWSLKRQRLLVGGQYELKQHASVTNLKQGKHDVTTYETMDPEELELESIQHWLLALTRPGNRAVHWLQEKSLWRSLRLWIHWYWICPSSLWVKHLCWMQHTQTNWCIVCISFLLNSQIYSLWVIKMKS